MREWAMAYEGPPRRLPYRKGSPLSSHERARQQASACQQANPVRIELLMQLHHHVPFSSFLYIPCLCPTRTTSILPSHPEELWPQGSPLDSRDPLGCPYSFENHQALFPLDSKQLLRGHTRPFGPIAHSTSTATRMASSVVKRMPSSAASASSYA